jgi:Na+-transporting NADH:ubiquinone oxidoreductase subunit A
MKAISIKKGYNLKVSGVPSLECRHTRPPSQLAVLPVKIPFIKPRLSVKEGDMVDVGSELFFDKKKPEIIFCSPGAGKIETIAYGRRRVIEEVVISLKDEETFKEFPSFDGNSLEDLSREDLIETLLNGGLWPLIRELPIRNIAPTDIVPPRIIVSISNQEPFQAKPQVYLQGKEKLFEYGLKVLNRLCPNKVLVSVCKEDAGSVGSFSKAITHKINGKYPADDPGVLNFHIKAGPEENRAWFIHGQDLLQVAELLKTGRYPTERIIAVGGPSFAEPKHFKTRLGAPIIHLTDQNSTNGDTRFIAGGVFTGYKTFQSGFIGFYERGITLIPEGNTREFMTLIQPGFDRPSYSRAFLSSINKADFNVDGNTHGGVRACIGCSHCMQVCPVDILPLLTYKALLVDEIEEALAHGLLDCVECGLCSYVCPSKIELTETLKAAKAQYHKEQA